MASNPKKTYTHLQCYHVLSPLPKWLSYCEQLKQKKSKLLSDSKKLDLPSDVSVPQSEAASDATTTNAREPIRPIGNKKAKDARAEELKDTKWKQDLVKVQRDLANQSQAQIAILAEQKEAVISMAEEAVMMVDPTTIPEARRPFFEWKQNKTMDKMRKEQQKEKEEEEKKTKEEEEKKKKEEEEKKKRGEAKKEGKTNKQVNQKQKPKKTIAQVKIAAAKTRAVQSRSKQKEIKIQTNSSDESNKEDSEGEGETEPEEEVEGETEESEDEE
ncbi:hypothetical protein PTTG_01671 [Puccinia triticina 1-1 BBBD Race 1]|uniref:NAM-associated domain-containing protein n=1 Tax=Puccinia triticina (isolate 1-1 / race 1 (BBBD)) TaxID=630390 RepID=A0A0C4ELN7_PUCT1|nr:hypothetical protein PTTG_01671 [Puccinia triticina 1-1 BBBD Race 1]